MTYASFYKMVHKNISLMTAIERAQQRKAQEVSFNGREWAIGTTKIPHHAKQRNCIGYLFARIIHALRMLFCGSTYGKAFKNTVRKFEAAYFSYKQGEIVKPSSEEKQPLKPIVEPVPVKASIYNTFSRARRKLVRSVVYPSNTSGSSQTTNPVYFLSRTGSASKKPTEAMAGVMKSRFSSEIHFTQKVRDIFNETYKNSTKELIRTSLKGHIPELYQGFIKDEPESIEKMFFDTKPSEIVTNIPKIVQALENIRDRYINTALFAVEFDQLCETHLTPASCEQEMRMLIRTSKSEKQIFVRGIFQSGIHFIPLNKGVEEKKDYKEMQNLFDTLDEFIDEESYQQAVIRTTELADADLHAGNVALVPKRGTQVLNGITKLSSDHFYLFVTTLKAFSKDPQEVLALIQNVKKQLGEQQASFFEKTMNESNPKDETIAAFWAAMTGPGGLRFEIKLFDVDLTMPETNKVSMRGTLPLVRNILLALPKADHPLTDKRRLELRLRRNIKEKIIQSAEKRFNHPTAQALRERMESLIAAAEEKVMTPKGLVWRAIPQYALFDAAWDAMGDDSPRAEKYASIGTEQASTLLDFMPHISPPIEIPISQS